MTEFLINGTERRVLGHGKTHYDAFRNAVENDAFAGMANPPKAPGQVSYRMTHLSTEYELYYIEFDSEFIEYLIQNGVSVDGDGLFNANLDHAFIDFARQNSRYIVTDSGYIYEFAVAEDAAGQLRVRHLWECWKIVEDGRRAEHVTIMGLVSPFRRASSGDDAYERCELAYTTDKFHQEWLAGNIVLVELVRIPSYGTLSGKDLQPRDEGEILTYTPWYLRGGAGYNHNI